jgi:hypothetical protein
MPPTLANGKICYIEMPATDIARSAEFYRRFFGGTSRRATRLRSAEKIGVGLNLRFSQRLNPTSPKIKLFTNLSSRMI